MPALAENDWLKVVGFDGPEDGRVAEGRVGGDGQSLRFGMGSTGHNASRMVVNRNDCRTREGTVTYSIKIDVQPQPRTDDAYDDSVLPLVGATVLDNLSLYTTVGVLAGLTFASGPADPRGVVVVTFPQGAITARTAFASVVLDANGFVRLRTGFEKREGKYRFRTEFYNPADGLWWLLDDWLSGLLASAEVGTYLGLSGVTGGNFIGSNMLIDDFEPNLPLLPRAPATFPMVHGFEVGDDSWKLDLAWQDASVYCGFGTLMPQIVTRNRPGSAGTKAVRLTRAGYGLESIMRAIGSPNIYTTYYGRKWEMWVSPLGGAVNFNAVVSFIHPDETINPTTLERTTFRFEDNANNPSFSVNNGGYLESAIALGEWWGLRFSVYEEVLGESTLPNALLGGNDIAVNDFFGARLFGGDLITIGAGNSAVMRKVTSVVPSNGLYPAGTITFDGNGLSAPLGTAYKISRMVLVSEYNRENAGWIVAEKEVINHFSENTLSLIATKTTQNMNFDVSDLSELAPDTIDIDDLEIDEIAPTPITWAEGEIKSLYQVSGDGLGEGIFEYGFNPFAAVPMGYAVTRLVRVGQPAVTLANADYNYSANNSGYLQNATITTPGVGSQFWTCLVLWDGVNPLTAVYGPETTGMVNF